MKYTHWPEFVHRDIFLNSISEFFVGNLMSVSSLKIYISNLWLKFYLCYQKWQYQGVKSSAMLKTTSSKNMGIVLHAYYIVHVFIKYFGKKSLKLATFPRSLILSDPDSGFDSRLRFRDFTEVCILVSIKAVDI